jgi:hypothetical protein
VNFVVRRVLRAPVFPMSSQRTLQEPKLNATSLHLVVAVAMFAPPINEKVDHDTDQK